MSEYVWTRNDRADHDAGHPSGYDCDGYAMGSGEACGQRFPDTPARTIPTTATVRAGLAADTAADNKVRWNRALKGGAR